MTVISLVVAVVAVVAVVVFTSPAVAQSPVGALAVDERQGDHWGWAVDYETTAAARAVALRECGAGCSVVLTFDRCGAYVADQDNASTAFGWAEAYASADAARQRALAECRSRGGSGCVVRVWGCNGPVVEEGLGLDRAARRQIQQGLQAGGFDPGGADGLFGPRTRAAIRSWESARGARTTGYLDGPQVEALRARGEFPRPAPASPQPVAATADTQGLEVVFWQSIVNSTNPAEFEAYLGQFPNGVFRALAEARLAALRGSAGSPSAGAQSRAGGIGAPASGSRVSGAPARASGSAAAGDARSTTSYQLSAAIHRAPRGCGDTHSRRDRLYTRIWARDPELEGRIDAVERRTEQLLGSINMTHAEWDLDSLAERELRSGVEPLSEAERRALARLREAKRAFDRDPLAAVREALDQGRPIPPPSSFASFSDEDELEALEARAPLSPAESVMLRQGQELFNAWNRLKSERRPGVTNPGSMRVYENERLDVRALA